MFLNGIKKNWETWAGKSYNRRVFIIEERFYTEHAILKIRPRIRKCLLWFFEKFLQQKISDAPSLIA